eukprot:gb/GEZN01008503.1/.p1 GENE.gb/GEZN01008503.1/~~gb/GEZN01008503.1/.p1  ORF type:complete len:392 (-),score=88.59 gb/GEZN01008503.1/:244-1305(-)
MFQVIQAPKSKKFNCRVCQEKQSVRKLYASSDCAKDVREVVMRLNMGIGETQWKEEALASGQCDEEEVDLEEEVLDEQDVESTMDGQDVESTKLSRWTALQAKIEQEEDAKDDNEEEEGEEADGYVFVLPENQRGKESGGQGRRKARSGIRINNKAERERQLAEEGEEEAFKSPVLSGESKGRSKRGAGRKRGVQEREQWLVEEAVTEANNAIFCQRRGSEYRLDREGRQPVLKQQRVTIDQISSHLSSRTLSVSSFSSSPSSTLDSSSLSFKSGVKVSASPSPVLILDQQPAADSTQCMRSTSSATLPAFLGPRETDRPPAFPEVVASSSKWAVFLQNEEEPEEEEDELELE